MVQETWFKKMHGHRFLAKMRSCPVFDNVVVERTALCLVPVRT
jgi:hypothetical protein